MTANDLIDAIDELRGACPELDQIADSLESLATRRYDRDLRQTVVARLAGSDDDTVTVIARLVHHLCTTSTDLNTLPHDDRKTLEQHGQETVLLLSQSYLHQPASEASALIDPSGSNWRCPDCDTFNNPTDPECCACGTRPGRNPA